MKGFWKSCSADHTHLKSKENTESCRSVFLSRRKSRLRNSATNKTTMIITLSSPSVFLGSIIKVCLKTNLYPPGSFFGPTPWDIGHPLGTVGIKMCQMAPKIRGFYQSHGAQVAFLADYMLTNNLKEVNSDSIAIPQILTKREERPAGKLLR